MEDKENKITTLIKSHERLIDQIHKIVVKTSTQHRQQLLLQQTNFSFHNLVGVSNDVTEKYKMENF